MQSPGSAFESADVNPPTVLVFTVRRQDEAGGGGLITVTVEVSAFVPLCWVAITWNVPVVVPAVYSPPALIVPPVAEYVTVGTVDEPSLQVPETANWLVLP